MLLLTDALNDSKIVSELNLDDWGFGALFTIAGILIGGILYSMDIPRWFSKCYSTLPSNLIKKNNDLSIKDDLNKRYEENEYYKFYYKNSSDSKYKTEIQSGFFHLFVNMSFVTLVATFIYIPVCCLTNNSSPFLIINSTFFIISSLSAIIIYHQKLKYSWKRNYEEFIEYKKNESKKKNKR